MKKIAITLLLAVLATAAWGQDPLDSVILESKTAAPGGHPGAASDTAAHLYIKVFITNKDSLTFVTLALIERSTSGGAYMILARPRNFDGMVSHLTTTLRTQRVASPNPGTLPGRIYNGVSPDSMLFAGGFDPLDFATIEPPNLARKALWEIKFDSVFSNPGTVELNTAHVIIATAFTNTIPKDLPVNFAKGVITVADLRKGDLDMDGQLSGADAALALNCVFCALCAPPPAGIANCDLNCDGARTAADVAWELYAVFVERPFPC